MRIQYSTERINGHLRLPNAHASHSPQYRWCWDYKNKCRRDEDEECESDEEREARLNDEEVKQSLIRRHIAELIRKE
jgi:hypothetical protein